MNHQPRKFEPSPQQADVLQWTSRGSGSAVVEAVAGAGKTSTLVELLKLTSGSVAFMAYNREIAGEIKARVEPLGLGNRVRCGTCHSFGNSALWKAFPGANLEPKKLRKLLDLRLRQAVPEELDNFVLSAVAMAKQVGIGAVVKLEDARAWSEMFDHHDLLDLVPENGEDVSASYLIGLCQHLLVASWDATPEVYDFDDMIYEPVRRGLRVWQNDWVLLDEAQDTNPMRRALARMMLRPRGRLVAVGDPRQAIYGFTGADADSLDRIREEFNAVTLPLTVTYRCPKAVVEVARRWVSHISPAETAPEGWAEHVFERDFWEHTVPNLTKADAVLCRNTRPLVSLAYALLRRGVGCRIEGRSIGEGLKALTWRWKRVKLVEPFLERLTEWSEKEIAKAVAAGNEGRAETIEDQAETLKEIASTVAGDDDLNVLRAKIDALFGDTPPGEKPNVLVLSTIHRSKGREWPTVVWWGAEQFSPSKYARQAWQLLQEDNLCYVAATRAKERLVMVEVSQ